MVSEPTKKERKAQTKNTCASLPPVHESWMKLREVSVRDSGTCNVLVVAPHGFPGNDDNTEILAYRLAQKLEAYAVVNNRKYKRPGERWANDEPGFVADLNSPEDVQKSAPDFFEKLMVKVDDLCKKYKKAIVVFIHGMGDDKAGQKSRATKCDIGVGYSGSEHDPAKAFASKDFVKDLRAGLKANGMWPAPVGRWFTGSGTMAAYFRGRKGYENVEAVQLEFRYEGLRESSTSIEAAADTLCKTFASLENDFEKEERLRNPLVGAMPRALTSQMAEHAVEDDQKLTLEGDSLQISGEQDTSVPDSVVASEFQSSIQDLSEAKSAQTGPVILSEGSGSEHEVEAVSTSPLGDSEETPEPLGSHKEGFMAKHKEEFPIESDEPSRMVVGEERFQQIMADLQIREKITDDKGEEINFGGEVKTEFIGACETAYPVIKKTYEDINELGRILGEVRFKLKPLGIYHSWLRFINLPRRTAQNYVQVHERYKPNLPAFAHLGIRKLLIASKLDDCAVYVARNLPKIEAETVDELETEVKAVLRKGEKTKKKGGGRPSKALRIGSCTIRASSKGDKITIEGLTKKRQTQLIEAINKLLSQDKE
jgi:hypothetical protein